MGVPPVRIALAALVGFGAAALGAASCDLVLDIGSLDRGSPDGGGPDGAGPDGRSDGGPDGGPDGSPDGGGLDGGPDGGNQVEVIATGQCYPGDLALADGYVYWGTTAAAGACATANAILRLPIPDGGADAAPTTVVSHDLGGPDAGGRPWTIVVAGAGVYWLGCGTLCTAYADQQLQGCTLALKPPACAAGVALSGSTLVLANGCGGTCSDPAAGKGALETLDTLDGGVSGLGLQVVGDGGLEALAAGDTPPLVVSWIDGSGCVRLGSAGAPIWSSCDLMPGSPAFPVAVVNDGEQVYWIEGGTNGTYNLVGHSSFNPNPITFVTGIGTPLGMALDGSYVYFTAADLGGSVYAVSRLLTHPTAIADLPPLAAGRAHPGHSGPYRITAADPTWLYWVNVAPDGTVERILKPLP